MADTNISDERLAEIRQKVREEVMRSAAILRPEELALTVDDVLERALRAQGGVRAEGTVASFQMLMAAYIRGNDWAHEYGLGAEGRYKAAYDYADKTLSSLEASPAPVSEEMVERINEQVEHVRLGIACRTPDLKAATIELLNQVTALTAALAAKGGQ